MRMLQRSIVLALSLTLLLAQLASAVRSVPSLPLSFQSANNDGRATRATTVRAAGSSWTSARLDRLQAAATEWRTDTDFDPTLNRTVAADSCYDSLTCHGVWMVTSLQLV